MIIIFLLIVCLLNNIFASNKAIGFYIKNDYLGGRSVGIIFTYIFFIATIFISYKTNQNIFLNTLFFVLGSVMNYFLYTVFYQIHLKRYGLAYEKNKSLFLLNHKEDFLNDLEKNILFYKLEKTELLNLKNNEKINKKKKEKLINILEE